MVEQPASPLQQLQTTAEAFPTWANTTITLNQVRNDKQLHERPPVSAAMNDLRKDVSHEA